MRHDLFEGTHSVGVWLSSQSVGNQHRKVYSGLLLHEIPVGIRAIGPRAFANRTQLTKVIIPSYVNSIGESAFESCAGVTEVVITGNRNSDLLLDTKAFFACNNLAKITATIKYEASTDNFNIQLKISLIVFGIFTNIIHFSFVNK